nr:MBL fold metallo-hydrolase [uncultured Desulfobulbus sp.]
MIPRITHLGAENCVTGSCHLVESNPEKDEGVQILVDCGATYGKDLALPFDQFPVCPASIQYLFLTHAHIDHIGRVPDLIEAGFRGEIICSHATKALLVPMLHDALSFGHDRRSRNEINNLERLIDELSWGFELHKQFTLRNGISFKLCNAGHILGSCFIQFYFSLQNQSEYKVVFSGDLGCSGTPILPDPDRPENCDLLILESTYGDRFHPDRNNRIAELRDLLKMALADEGIVYIPAFALGRTQELLYELDRIGMDVPVFVDSPLGLKITEIYSSLESFWDAESRSLMARGDHPFDFKGLYAVRRFKDHEKLLQVKGPAIVIAGSGMCTGGRIVDHFERGLDDPKNDVFFVGYQAKGTLGRQLVDGTKSVRAKIYSLSGYSAHADQKMLVDWVRSMPKPPGEVRLVHGDREAQEALRRALE